MDRYQDAKPPTKRFQILSRSAGFRTERSKHCSKSGLAEACALGYLPQSRSGCPVSDSRLYPCTLSAFECPHQGASRYTPVAARKLEAAADRSQTLWRCCAITYSRSAGVPRNNIHFQAIGRLDALPTQVRRELDAAVDAASANRGLLVNLAINYGGRDVGRAEVCLLTSGEQEGAGVI